MVSSGPQAIACILLVLSIVPFAQAQAAPDNASAATVTGKVTIKSKGAPGVAVVLVRNVEGYHRTTRHRAVTDETGTYRITNVSPGNYIAQTAAPGFIAVDEFPTPSGKSTTLIINKDETVKDIDFELVRGGVITGRVTDSDGHPLIEETVSLSNAEPNPRNSSGHRNARTDDRGVYRIFGIPPGNYKVAAGTNEVSASWERSGFRQTFHPDVTDSSMAPVINVTEGGETTNVDITLKVSRTYSVRGRIIDGDTGQPVPNVQYGIMVYLSPNHSSGMSDGSVSNSNGEFQWENLKPGKYGVYVNTPPGADWRSEEARFEINESDVTGVVVKTTKTTVVSGVIVLNNTNDKSVLARLGRAQVSYRIENEGKTSTSSGSTRTGPDGSFRFTSLPAGVATFDVEATGLELVSVERNGVVQLAGIQIRDREQISGLRLIVQYGDASIRGVLKLPNDEVLPANVRFFVSLKTIGEPVRQSERSGGRSVVVDARGQFLVEGLLPGTYEVTAQSYTVNAPHAQTLSGKEQITVTEGGVANVTVTLQRLAFPNRP